jgi:hypothetical protein
VIFYGPKFSLLIFRTALKREDVEFSLPLQEAKSGKETEFLEDGQEDKVRSLGLKWQRDRILRGWTGG